MDPGVRVKIQHSPSQHPIVVVGKGVLANPRRFITQNQRRLDGQIRFLEIDLRDADDVRVIRKRVVQDAGVGSSAILFIGLFGVQILWYIWNLWRVPITVRKSIDEKTCVAKALTYGKQAYLQRRISSEASIAKLLFQNGYKLADHLGLFLRADDEQ